MRVAVVGTIVADTIEADDGTLADSLGGIAHTVGALSALGGDALTIEPICRVGADSLDRIERWAAGLTGVCLDAIRPMDAPNPCVYLSYAAAVRAGERIERLTHCPPPLDAADVEPAFGADAVIANFITGSDWTPAAMAALAEECRWIHLDVHSLALATADDGTRSYARRDDWWDWLGAADTVQCNTAEAATICGFDPAARADDIADAFAAWLAAELRGRQRPAVWLLTLAEGGATALRRARGRTPEPAASRQEPGAGVAPPPGDGIEILRQPAAAVDVVDPTGAGDAFGAGYVCARLQGLEVTEALRRAVASGSIACTCAGVPSPAAFQKGLSSAI